jgi:nitroreductase
LQPLRDLAASFAAGMDPAARHAWCCRQLYLALGQLMTTAAMLGVDSCPLEGLDPAAYDRQLGLSASGFTTVVACALGYRSPADKHATLPKARFPLATVVQTV